MLVTKHALSELRSFIATITTLYHTGKTLTITITQGDFHPKLETFLLSGKVQTASTSLRARMGHRFVRFSAQRYLNMRRDSSFCAKSVRYNIFTNGAPYARVKKSVKQVQLLMQGGRSCSCLHMTHVVTSRENPGLAFQGFVELF